MEIVGGGKDPSAKQPPAIPTLPPSGPSALAGSHQTDVPQTGQKLNVIDNPASPFVLVNFVVSPSKCTLSFLNHAPMCTGEPVLR